MSRAQRLLQLLQILRRHRHPVRGRQLAAELGISLRTLYRDIAALQSQGADIQGEAGLGYVLRPGFTLPPLMFTHREIAALVLGSRWVAQRTDTELAHAATEALDKIAAVLPAHLRSELDTIPLLVGPQENIAGTANHRLLRQAIHDETRLRMRYLDLKGASSERLVWPVAIGYFEQIRVLIAWCELRNAFRHFRIDRIQEMVPTDTRYPRRRLTLLKEWKQQEDIAG